MVRKTKAGKNQRFELSLYAVYRLFFPEKHPGRPGSHPLSKLFRRLFESRRTRRAIGAGLTLLVMGFGLLSNLFAAETQATEVAIINQPQEQITTRTTLNKPLEGRFAQGFHAFHKGIDLLAPVGTPITPVDSGQVTEVSFGRLGWGHTVVVEHANGLASRYAHLKEIKVIVGEQISKDQVLGTVGMTGWTTGPHLHLEIYQNDKAIDPAAVLPAFTSPDYAIAKAK